MKQKLQRAHVSVQEYVNNGLDERFLHVLNDLDQSLADCVRLCHKKFSFWECENGNKFLAGSLSHKDTVCAGAMINDLAEDGLEILHMISARIGGKVRIWDTVQII